METKIFKGINQLKELQSQWHDLENIAPHVTYFSTFRYIKDWWESYSDDKSIKPYIVAVYHENRIVGLAPLQIKTYRSYLSKYDELQFAHEGGDYANFIISHTETVEPSKIVNEILKTIINNNTDYDKISLTHINGQSLLAHQILISHQNAELTYLVECPFIDFSQYKAFEDYTKTYLPKKIKQYINRFKREIDYSILVTSDNLVEKFAEVHIAEKNYLKEKGFSYRHSFFENAREVAFRKTLYSDNENVLTYMLVDNSNNEIICYYTGYIYRNIYHSVTTAYHPKYAHLAVGKIFNYMIFEENYNNKRWEIFDMGTGRYSWKFEMTNDFNLLYRFGLNVFRSKWSWLCYSATNFLSNIHHHLLRLKRDDRYKK